ncbi:hypothetical protein JHK85_012786 [Glycine max]|nr:hypothetical protein JHK85_012786 [Glycine max]
MQGLVTTERNSLDPAAAPFAKNPRDIEGLTEGASIIEVVKKIRSHVLLGLSGVGGIFNEESSSSGLEKDKLLEHEEYMATPVFVHTK